MPATTPRFLKDAPGDGRLRRSLRGIKDSSPYMHDGRCLTLEDTVGILNLILQERKEEKGETAAEEEEAKSDVVAFMNGCRTTAFLMRRRRRTQEWMVTIDG